MGARGVRIRKIFIDERTREKIRTTQIMKRLQAHVFGEIELTPAQVRSAEVLLRKSLPDLSATATADANTEQGQQILGWADDNEDPVPSAPVISIVPRSD